MSAVPSRRSLGVAAALALLALGSTIAAVRARRSRAAWWGRAERVCACGESTRRALGRLSQEAVGGLGEVAGAQRALLQSDCDDLRVAVSRRSWSDELAGRPLRVIATEQHHQRAASVSRSLEAMCGGAHEEFWQRLSLDLAAHPVVAPADDPYRVRATARGHLSIRQAMCAGRSRLTIAPRSYALTPADAERQASECVRELATRGR